ncbi:hypothetical protein KKI24_22340 [bacterium]|nr:hypothetical protein [bacterium]
MKGSYRISRLLKRFIRHGFGDTFMDPDISDSARQNAEAFYAKQNPLPLLRSSAPLSGGDHSPEKQAYLDYQREIQAGSVSGNPDLPQSPGKVLKLPLNDDKDDSVRD